MTEGHFELPKDLQDDFETTKNSRVIKGSISLVYKDLRLRRDNHWGNKGSNSFVIKYGSLCREDIVFDIFEHEAGALLYFNGTHVVSLFGHNFDGELPWLLLEEGGKDICSSRNETNLEEKLEFIKGLLNALKHIHELGGTHQDIKIENFLERIKLIDFGNSSYPYHQNSHLVTYASPEDNYDIRSDIFQIGLFVTTLFLGNRILKQYMGDVEIKLNKPRKILTYNDSGKLVIHEQYKGGFNYLRDYFDGGYPLDTGFEDINNIIRRATRKDPNDRYQNTDEMLKDVEGLEAKLKENCVRLPEHSDPRIRNLFKS